MEILRIEDLCKVYGEGENAVHALDHVSFSANRGEFISIVGSSGSGKSTLLHLIGGVDSPSSGKVTVGGVDVYAQNEEELAIFRRRQVGLIYQSLMLFICAVNGSSPKHSAANGTDTHRIQDSLKRQMIQVEGRRKHTGKECLHQKDPLVLPYILNRKCHIPPPVHTVTVFYSSS